MVRCNVRLSKIEALCLGVIFLGAVRLPACGPDFPNNLLDRGDQAVLDAPVADFIRELERMKLAAAEFLAVTSTNTYAQQTANLELTDLQATLQAEGRPAAETARIMAAFTGERTKLQTYVDAWEAWKNSAPWEWSAADTNMIRGRPPEPPPKFPEFAAVAGLPAEFADYFAGAVSWKNPGTTNSADARVPWERVLQLPAAQRHFESTWAAFMLGKSWVPEDPARARAYFEQVRVLARQGFADADGLAVAGEGLEARLNLKERQFGPALDLYLEQLRGGDSSADQSLAYVVQKAFSQNDAGILPGLAGQTNARRVVTAFLISRAWSEEPGPTRAEEAARWLAAVAAAGVTDVESAEELALAAYQTGHWEDAQRWVNRAPDSPVAQWLQAKLLLQSGQVRQAGALLAKVARRFPVLDSSTNAPPALADDLTMPRNDDVSENLNLPRQVLGELGVFHLARREYTEALDALVRAGYWSDAAYVAERVLTVEELKDYVDRNWPAAAAPANADEQPEQTVRDQIRYLLGRRLARMTFNMEGDGMKPGPRREPPLDPAARPYYPAECQAEFDLLQQALQTGRDTSLTAMQRAAALVSAAYQVRTNGMELLGTEEDPDWPGVSANTRTNDQVKLLGPSADELRRVAEHGVAPELRYHYRYNAAQLVLAAARLMPDDTDTTAQLLDTAGSWVKYLDPARADVIYKTLVRRCRHTEIGNEADAIRWFPELDAAGHPFPYKPHGKLLASSDRLDYIQMFNRQEGWALNGRTNFPTNDWRYLNNAILRTTNGGQTWAVVLRAQARARVTAFFYDADTAWATSVYDEDTNITVLKTRSGGGSWAHGGFFQTAPIQNAHLLFKDSYTGWLMLIPDHGMSTFPGDLYHTGDGGTYGGDEWQAVNHTGNWPDADDDTNAADDFAAPHPSLPCGGSVTWRDMTNGWLLGSMSTTSPDHLFATVDGGQTWQLQTLPVPAMLSVGKMVPDNLPQFFPSAGSAGIVSAGFLPEDVYDTNHSEVIYRTSDGGVTWRPTTPVKNGGVSCFLSALEGWLWSQAPVHGVLQHTVDGGNTWTPVTEVGGLASGLTQRDRILQLDFVDAQYGWALIQQWSADYPARLLQTTDGGMTWRKLP